MTRTGLVVPAVRTDVATKIAWTDDAALLPLLHGAISCSTVAAIPFNILGPDADHTTRADLTAWIDDEGAFPTVDALPLPNLRVMALFAGFGYELVHPVFGTVVITGGADAAGATLGLHAELLADLTTAIGVVTPERAR